MDIRHDVGIQKEVSSFLEKAAQSAASQAAFDVLFIAGLPPLLALASEVLKMPQEPLTTEDIGSVIRFLLEYKVGRYLPFNPDQVTEAQFVAEIPGVARYRVAIYRQRGTLAVVLRTVSRSLPPLEALGVPEQITAFLRRRWGLILVAGPSAAGKSTTIAAMVEYINRNMTRHIISVENPVEYTHQRVYSLITQRSIPEDTPSYARAVRAALRQIPDVLAVGDVQDQQTAHAALTAAESGHLVIAAVHSKDAADAVHRLQSFFGPAQKIQVGVQIANTLLAILVQQLLPRRTETGRVLATELLIATTGIRHMIRTGQTYRLNTFMQSGRNLGMHTMEDSLAQFARAGVIDYGEALTATADVGLFLNLFRKRRDAEGRGTGRVVMSRHDSDIRPGPGAYGITGRPEGTIYRTDLLNVPMEAWSSNGLLNSDDGAIRFLPDPFQSALYAQVTDYTIWLGHRLPFKLTNFARVIARARLVEGDAAGNGDEEGAPRARVWVLAIGTNNAVVTLPDERDLGVELVLDDQWRTLYIPVPEELVGFEVRAYALRISRQSIDLRLREVLFS